MNFLTQKLFEIKDEKYRIFSKKLIPDTKKEIIGVRSPLIKNIISKYKSNQELCENFLSEKHIYHEEFLLHGLIISTKKDIDQVFNLLNEFVFQIDNWAVCDCTVSALKIINKHPKLAIEQVKRYLKSDRPYVVRFGIVVLLTYFLDKNFSDEILSLIKSIKSENYYVNMAIAWFYSVALVKKYQHTIGIIESKTLDKFVHNKSIQKTIESFRISNDKKIYLKTLKI